MGRDFTEQGGVYCRGNLWERNYQSNGFTRIQFSGFCLRKKNHCCRCIIFDTEYDDTREIENTSLENAVYMGLKNDVSCILDFHLALLGHRSTVNPNMPPRSLMYVADLYEGQTLEWDLYSGRRIMLPNPEFVVFYNGLDE